MANGNRERPAKIASLETNEGLVLGAVIDWATRGCVRRMKKRNLILSRQNSKNYSKQHIHFSTQITGIRNRPVVHLISKCKSRKYLLTSHVNPRAVMSSFLFSYPVQIIYLNGPSSSGKTTLESSEHILKEIGVIN